MISTTISKKFFDMKMEYLAETGFFWEFKEFKKFWIKQLDTLVYHQEQLPMKINFLIGNKPRSFTVTKVWIFPRISLPDKYQPAILTEKAYGIKCVPIDDENQASSHNVPRIEIRGMTLLMCA